VGARIGDADPMSDHGHPSATGPYVDTEVGDAIEAAVAVEYESAHADGDVHVGIAEGNPPTIDDEELTSQHALSANISMQSGPPHAAAAVPVANASADPPTPFHYYTPPGSSSPAWAYFRLRSDRPKHEHYCQMPGCNIMVQSKTGTRNLWQHLERKHELCPAAAKAQAARQQGPPSQPRPRASIEPSTPLALGTAASPCELAPSTPPTRGPNPSSLPKQNRSLGPPPVWHMLLPLDAARQRRIAEAAVRNVLVPNMRPLNWVCTPGFQKFVDIMAGILGATHKWHIYNDCIFRRVVEKDYQAMRLALQQCVSQVPWHCQTLHHDAWEDLWKRTWVCGALFFLDPVTWAPTWFVTCFHCTAPWTGPDTGGQHDPAVCATTLSSAHVSQLGLNLPMWGASDNANPAVSVSHALGLRVARCLAHILVIPIKRLLVAGYVKHPRLPRLIQAFEVLRDFAKHYYKKPANRAAWDRVPSSN